MSSGKVGCTFAALFARNPDSVNWKTIKIDVTMPLVIPEHCSLLSIQFEGSDKDNVIAWALDNGFYTEDNGEGCIGLRYISEGVVSWVQYFGPDSHVATRQAPIPELCLCLKLPALHYFKVGFKGVLHLAHASVKGFMDHALDLLWRTSHTNTEKRLGHKPTLREAAKTTYIK